MPIVKSGPKWTCMNDRDVIVRHLNIQMYELLSYPNLLKYPEVYRSPKTLKFNTTKADSLKGKNDRAVISTLKPAAWPILQVYKVAWYFSKRLTSQSKAADTTKGYHWKIRKTVYETASCWMKMFCSITTNYNYYQKSQPLTSYSKHLSDSLAKTEDFYKNQMSKEWIFIVWPLHFANTYYTGNLYNATWE